ncbi:hypothetical protein G7Y89_g7421 [Cudoniella acicularis]|uniref:Alcohol dehydrogenase-like C-terminal domain-containing protein n=1 Tax=Cudoniella acicularis TaxID=354080 RepID=A0A8H4RM36_9HELO|nr:hypothetical protein G7Y89_g7421 [Cudoniella acicularis]
MVVGVCSTGNVELVKGLGADEVIDYRQSLPVYEQLIKKFGANKFDVIIDTVGIQELFHNCAQILKPGKPYLSLGVQPSKCTIPALLYSVCQILLNALWPRFLGGVDRKYVQVNGFASLENLEALAEMAEKGTLRVPIDSQWEFGDVQKAYEKILSKSKSGKVIVNVESSRLSTPSFKFIFFQLEHEP